MRFDRLHNLPNLEQTVLVAKRRVRKKYCDEKILLTVKVSSPLWKLVRIALGGMKISDLECRPDNLSFHNLCTFLSPPVGCRNFLGLNLKFCISRPTLNQNTDNTIRRLIRTVRIRDIVENKLVADDPEEYIPKLYSPWEGDPPHIEKGPAEAAMLSFANALEVRKKYHAATAYKRWNLSQPQREAWKTIVSDRRFIIMMSDKNLGPVIMERDTYMSRVMSDHLGNPEVYTRLKAEEAIARMKTARQDL